MRRSTGVFAADTVARDNTRITIQAIHGSMRDIWNIGSPVLVAHDGCRPIGWSWPTSIYLEPGRGLLLGTLWEPESQEESQALAARYNSHLHERIAKHTEEGLPKLKALLVGHLDGSEQPIDTDATALVGSGLARRVASSIFAKEDKDGLVPLNLLTPVRVFVGEDKDSRMPPELRSPVLPGVFRFGDFLLFAHPYFRRSLSRLNPLNFDLLSTLHHLGRNDPSVKIKLDPDAVGLVGTARKTIEYAYWRGPLFNDSLAEIPPGVTVYEADGEQRLFNQISRTEFWWQSRLNKSKNIREHILEVEELRDQPTNGGLLNGYGCRYVHSIVREDDGVIEHLDGAIREYGEEEILVRLDLDIASSGRHTKYTKLWRADGNIPFGVWKTLVYHCFRENPLVGEYLTGQKDPVVEEIQREARQQESLSVVERLVPYSINAGDGIRLSLLYRSGSIPQDDTGRWLLPNAKLGMGESRFSVVDVETVELCKALRRVGEGIYISPEIRFVAFIDRYAWFPPILHASRESLVLTLRALRLLVDAWQSQGEDRVISFSLGVVDGDRQLWVSTLGHILDVAAWLECGQGFPPATEDGVDAWLDFAKGHLGDLPVRCSSSLSGLLEHDGTFCVFRTRVAPDCCTVRKDSDGVGLSLELTIPPEDEALQEAVESEKLTFQLACFVESVRCPICSDSYVDCAHSVCLDSSPSKPTFHGKPIFPFWTDRPA